MRVNEKTYFTIGEALNGKEKLIIDVLYFCIYNFLRQKENIL